METTKLAILGCGGMSGEHARRLRGRDDVQIVALCDVSNEVVEGYINRNLPDYPHKPVVYTDFAAMLSEQKPDGVIIVTPHTMHFEHGMMAIEAGCHVFMEKPMVTDSKQAAALKEAVDKSGKILVVGYNTPCTPEYRWLRDAIRSEKFGKLETITAWQTQNWAKGTKGSWRQNPALSGGGQMYDSGAHIFNSLVWSVENPVESVFAFIDNVGTPVDINGTVNVRFQNGVLAAITIAGNCPTDGAGAVYTFEGARVEVDAWNGNWIRLVLPGNKDGEIELEGERESPDDNFIKAIRGEAQPQTSPLNGLIQSQLMDAIYQSAANGELARVDNS